MIGYITGTIRFHNENFCVIETSGGVGYEIHIPAHTLRDLLAEPTVVSLHVVTIVREDAITLFGFSAIDDKQMFLTLTSISKVGARTAIAILETFSTKELYEIVAHGDPISLTKVSGIGKKTAQHILLELHYKLRSTSSPTSVGTSTHIEKDPAQSLLHQAEEALKNLGYQDYEIHSTLRTIITKTPLIDISSLIKEALRILSL